MRTGFLWSSRPSFAVIPAANGHRPRVNGADIGFPVEVVVPDLRVDSC